MLRAIAAAAYRASAQLRQRIATAACSVLRSHVLPRCAMRRIGKESSPYLDRYYLLGIFDYRSFPMARARLPWLPFTVYVHHIHRADRDEQLHNHPWSGFSIVLDGSYVEVRRATVPGQPAQGETEWRRVCPGDCNPIRWRYFHRIDAVNGIPAEMASIHDPGVWTLFVCAAPRRSWGFLEEDGTYVDHQTFLARPKETQAHARTV